MGRLRSRFDDYLAELKQRHPDEDESVAKSDA
jgi:hypothetical protein